MWDRCQDTFRQERTARRGARLALSQLVCPGRHTLTGLLYTCGRQFQDWSGDYRLFSRDQWDTRELFASLIRGLLELIPPADPLVVAMDDTLLRKTGTRIPGVGYRRDPLSPPFRVNLVRGQRFLQLSGLLPAGELPAAARAIPLRFEHAPSVPKPGKKASDEEKKAYHERLKADNLSIRGLRLLHQLREDLDRRPDTVRRLIAGVDGGYTNKIVLKGLPPRITLIGRVRKDAALFYPVTPEDQAAVGAKRHYGRSAPTPEQLGQDEATAWQEVPAFAAGRVHTFRVKTLAPLLWKTAGADRPLRLLVIAPMGYRLRKNSKLLYRRPAYLICTDVNLPLALLLQYYLWRWGVEVNHRDEKQIVGVGEAQVRAPRSADRQPAFAVAAYSALLLAAARAYGVDAEHGSLPLPKWQLHQPHPRISTQELIRELRSEVYAYGLRRLTEDSEPFATNPPAVTKASESQLSPASALIYAATG